MIVRVIDVFVNKESIDAFKNVTIQNRDGSIREPGILRFDVLQDSDDASHFVLYEVYRSQEATADHKETTHYRKWKTAVETMMAKPRESVACNPITPIGEDQW